MALSADDRKEVVDLMSEAVAEGLAKFRSKAEEEEAKNQQNNQGGGGNTNDSSGNSSSGFSLAGFLLGK